MLVRDRGDVGDELDIGAGWELAALYRPGHHGPKGDGEPRHQRVAALLGQLGVARQRRAQGFVGLHVSRPVADHGAQELDYVVAQPAGVGHRGLVVGKGFDGLDDKR